jgi:2-phospho-L-lactate guanylyltransferase
MRSGYAISPHLFVGSFFVRVDLVVPVKSFTFAKGRLATVLTENERCDLARACAERVVAAAGDWRVHVVCDDPDVMAWARSLGCAVVRPDVTGLNAAVDAGRHAASNDGAEHIVVAHSDLPLVRTFTHVVAPGIVTLVADRHGDGTNVVSMPATSPFRTSYGPGSFLLHRRHLEESGLDYRCLDDAELALDLDTADDLKELNSRSAT